VTTTLISQNSPDVLANKGVPIQLRMTRSDGQATYVAHPTATDTYYVRLTNWRLKLLEDQYGSLALWEKALDEKLFGTLMSTMALTLGDGWTEQRVGEAMLQGRLKDYRLAVAAAYGIALGRDPKDVLKALTTAEGDQLPETETETPAATTSDSSTTTAASAGLNSGPDGWGTVMDGTSSGTSPSDSSSPSSSQWQ
jgi:hypothetical protein